MQPMASNAGSQHNTVHEVFILNHVASCTANMIPERSQLIVDAVFS